eukprot:2417524-Rhodomonas_salina.1
MDRRDSAHRAGGAAPTLALGRLGVARDGCGRAGDPPNRLQAGPSPLRAVEQRFPPFPEPGAATARGSHSMRRACAT